MSNQNQEILAIIVLGALLALLLVGFIVAILFLYKKRQQQHSIEMATMQEEYNQQILRVQFEMQDATLAEISHKLHDALKGRIDGVIMDINGTVSKIEIQKIDFETIKTILIEANKTLNEIREDIRLTSHSLSSDRISQVGLIDAIKYEVKRIEKNSQYAVSIVANEVSKFGFKQEESVYLFRIFQEIIGNITAHAKATTIDIMINIDTDNMFLLQIADNGIGFNIDEKKKSKLSGIGLSGIQKRALQIGANLQIISLPNMGTTIKIQLLLTQTINQNKNGNNKEKEPHYSFN